MPEAALSDVLAAVAAAAAAIARHSLSTIFGAGRGVESFSNRILSLFFLRNHFVDAICQHRAVYNYGMGSGLVEL